MYQRIKYDTIQTDDYFLYFGRLSEEKGIMTLIKAMEGIKCSNLKIVGTGPLEEEIKKYIKNNNIANIEMLGFKSGKELYTIVGNAKAVVLPSEWYENGPYSAIESLKLGRIIIGSDLGGIPELIDGNGYIFEHGNIKELHEILEKVQNLDEKSIIKMQNKSYRKFEEEYTNKIHYRKIQEIYNKLNNNRITM